MATEIPIAGERKGRKSKTHIESSLADEKPNGKKPNGYSASEEKQPKVNFFQRLAQMTEDDWTRCKIYCYRRWPRVVKSGEPHYEATYREAVDEESIKRLHGSGRFLLRLNDQKRTIDQASLEIMDVNSPPKINPGELVDCHENSKFHELWPSAPSASKPTDGANANDSAAVRELVGLLKTLVTDRGKPETDEVKQTLINWALEQTAKQREESSPAALASLLTAVKDVMPNPAKEILGSDKSEVLAIIGALKGMQQDPLVVLQTAKELFGPTAEPERNHLAELDQILGFAQKLASLRGGAGDRTGWDIGLDFAKELGGPLLQTINNFMALRMGQRGGMQQPAPVAPTSATPNAFDPYANQAAMQEHARRMNAQTTAAPSVPQPSPTPPFNAAQAPASAPDGLPGVNEILPLLTQFGGLLTNALNSNIPGHHFARNVAELVGVATHAMIANHGEAALTANMMAVPEIAIFGESRLRKFAFEFVHYEEILDNEEEEDEPEPESKRDRATA
jgi:hypothetical protein